MRVGCGPGRSSAVTGWPVGPDRRLSVDKSEHAGGDRLLYRDLRENGGGQHRSHGLEALPAVGEKLGVFAGRSGTAVDEQDGL
jgi:hypothetical protein